jgi:ABC-2 type transport system permease protein
LARFLRLIKNEYVKILHKVSTWVMLGLIVLTALGLNLVSLVAQNSMQYNGYQWTADDVRDQINYLKNDKPDGYELEIERYEFMLENQIFDYNDWRYQALYDAFYEIAEDSPKPLTEAVADMKAALAKDDWRAYCNARIDLSNAMPELTAKEREEMQWEYRYRLDHDVPFDTDNWKSKLVAETASLRGNVQRMEEDQKSGQAVDAAALEKSQNTLAVNLYRLDNEIAVDTSTSGNITSGNINFWSVFGTSVSLIQVVSLLILVVAGSIVSSEFSNGTVKFLLINPVKRWKILTAKYATVLTFSYVLLVVFYLVNALFTMLFQGAGELGAPYLYVVNGAVHSMSGFWQMAWMYLLGSVNIVVMSTLAFAVSSLLRSSALAIGLSMFAMLAGSGITTFLKAVLKLDWARYLIFANTDLNVIINGTGLFANQTVPFALLVVAVHMLVFLWVAWDGFTRREV